MPKLVERYECEYCEKKNYKHKSSAVRHEKQCFANPDTKACRTCINYEQWEETVYNPHHGGDPGSTDYEIKRSWCSVHRKNFDAVQFRLRSNCVYYSKGEDNFKEVANV